MSAPIRVSKNGLKNGLQLLESQPGNYSAKGTFGGVYLGVFQPFFKIMLPKENQYFRDNQTYTISSSTLLASDKIRTGIVRRYTQQPNEEITEPRFLYRTVDREYFLIEDDSTPPVLLLSIEGARRLFKEFPNKMMSEVEAFDDSTTEVAAPAKQ